MRRRRYLLQLLIIVLATACTPALTQPPPSLTTPPPSATPRSSAATNPTPSPIHSPQPTRPSASSTPEEPRPAQRFSLPRGYQAELIAAPPLSYLGSIARGERGRIFLLRWGDEPGISILDQGQVRAILDLRSRSWVSPFLANGPGESVILGVDDQVWQIYPDGSHALWGKLDAGVWPLRHTSSGQLLGRSADGQAVVMLDPQGTSRVVADGFQSVFDIVAGADGTLFVADNVRGDLVRINPDGSRQVLASNLLTADPIHLALSADGRLYLNSIITRLVEVDPTTGNLRTIEGLYTPCTANPADFFVSDTGDLIFIDPQRNQVLQFDPRRGKLEILVPDAGLNSPAAAIGPDQDLYLGLGSCDPNIPARIVRIDEAGQQHTYFDQLDGYIQAIAFAPDGGLYIAQHPVTPGPGQLLYLPWQAERAQPIPGIATPFLLSMAVNPQSGNLFISRLEGAAVEEVSAGGLVARHPITLPKPAHDFYITFNPEGELFAYLSEGERNATGPVVDRWILRLDWEEGTSQLVLEFPRQGCCPMGNLTADSHGNLWWLVNPDARLMRISPDGTSEIFARNLPIDSAAVAVNDQGVIYITSPAGIYRFSP